MMPEITVIIPHLRQWAQLEECLTSLHAQSLARDRFSIIVIDNGSADFEDGRRRVAELYPDITITSEAKAGPGPARNKGIGLAKTDLIACIDADCIADNHWLETALTGLKKTGPGTIYGGDVRVPARIAKMPTAVEAYEAVFGFRQSLYIRKKGFSGTGNLAFWLSDFKKVGPFADINVAEDVDWGQRSNRLGLKILYLPQMIVFHPARSSRTELESKWRRHIAHELSLTKRKKIYIFRWLVHIIFVSVSWIPHLALVWTSSRLQGARARLKASAILIHLRLFRGREMFRQMVTEGNEAQRWNR